MPDWISTTLGVIIGGMLTMISSWFSDKRLNERESDRRRDERREKAAFRRSEFQRETLLALQEASQKLIRAAGATYHQDFIAFRKTGEWQRQLLSVDLDASFLQHNTDTMLLASRVRDDEIRLLADQLRSQVSALSNCNSETEARNLIAAAAGTQQQLIQCVGLILRELDSAETL